MQEFLLNKKKFKKSLYAFLKIVLKLIQNMSVTEMVTRNLFKKSLFAGRIIIHIKTGNEYNQQLMKGFGFDQKLSSAGQRLCLLRAFCERFQLCF